MMNERLIADAVKMVIDYFESEGIYEETKTLDTRARDWYSHTEIVEPQMLAAVVMSGDFVPGITWDEIKQIEDFFFPSEPIEFTNFHIGEIEEALDDELWR